MTRFPMPSCQGITVEEATIDQLQDYISHGKLTSLQILDCYLARVSQTNSYCKYGHLCLFKLLVELDHKAVYYSLTQTLPLLQHLSTQSCRSSSRSIAWYPVPGQGQHNH